VLAKWITSPNNPWFARAAVNRLWKETFGRGLVDPVDDFRPSNPASHPELLTALADDFATHRFDVRRTLSLLLTSRLFQTSSQPIAENAADRQFFSRYPLHRLTAEQQFDGLTRAVGVLTEFEGQEKGARVQQLLDANDYVEYLYVAGRNDRQSVGPFEPELTTFQALYGLASYDLQGWIGHEQGRARKLAESFAGADEIVEELFLAALTRFPTADERADCIRQLKASPSRIEGIEDLLWALVNAHEFGFLH
jgi:hypothetical protein